MNRHQVADLVATVIWGQDTANATRLGTLVVDALVEHGVLLLNQTTPGSPEAEEAGTGEPMGCPVYSEAWHRRTT